MRKILNILIIIALIGIVGCQKEDLTSVKLQQEGSERMANEILKLDDIRINYGGNDHDNDGEINLIRPSSEIKDRGINYGGNDHDNDDEG